MILFLLLIHLFFGIEGNTDGCCLSFGYGAFMEPCCFEYKDGVASSSCVTPSGMMGGGVKHFPNKECSIVKAETTGCCVSFGYGAFMEPCCFEYKDDVANSSCVVSPDLTGGSKMHFLNQRCSEVKTGCCVTFGYGSMNEPCCHQYEDGIFPDMCVVTGLGQGVEHYPGNSCSQVKEITFSPKQCNEKNCSCVDKNNGAIIPGTTFEIGGEDYSCSLVGCCVRFGYGAMMRPCCHNYVENLVPELCSSDLYGVDAFHFPHKSCTEIRKQTDCQMRRNLDIIYCKGLYGCRITQCEIDGSFSSKQKDSSTGYSWCVDSFGQEIEGSRMKGGNMSCVTGCCHDDLDQKDGVLASQCTKNFAEGKSCGEETTDKICEIRRMIQQNHCDGNMGCPIFVCLPDGSFRPFQCIGDVCYCVNNDGNKIFGSEYTLDQSKNCSLYQSPCQIQREKDIRNCSDRKGCLITTCTPDGAFTSEQCHGSTGFCWCVDSDGKQVGSEIRGSPNCQAGCCMTFGYGAMMKECCHEYQDDVIENACTVPILGGGALHYPGSKCEEIKDLTTCEKKRRLDKSLCGEKVGCFITTCESDGSFAPRQCHGSTGFCWCVDTIGNITSEKIRGLLPYQCLNTLCAERKFIDQDIDCEEDGTFSPMQCNISHCWCVDSDGVSVTSPSTEKHKCQYPTLCEARRSLEKYRCGNRIGCFITQCTENGDFSTQFWGSTGYSWCVNGKGEKIVSTEIRGDIICDACKKKQLEDARNCGGIGCYETQCEANCCFKSRQCFGSVCWCVDSKGEKVNDTHHEISKNRYCETKTPCESKPGFQCEPDGSFSPKQCIGKECWCTTMEGQKLPGNFENCECIRQQANDDAKCNGMNGCFRIECEDDGSFSPQQCIGSKCWCVKSNGEKLDMYGSRGEINCQRVSCRDEKKSRVELKCEEDGSYTPKQCNAEQCWCTTVNGKEISGTRRSSAQYLNCACFRQQSKDKKKCSGHGCFITQCDETDGSFVSKQCLGSVCWCVNFYGQKLSLHGARNLNCSTSCLRTQASDIVSCGDMLGCRIAKCDHDGSFSSLQCFQGHCSCFTPDGNEIEGSGFTSWGDIKSCECKVQQSINKANCGGDGCFETKCEADGSFSPLQCLGSKCWCVNAVGKELSVTGDRNLECDQKNCIKRQKEDERVCDGRLGCFKTQCEDDGSFKPVQCWESVCWCVDDYGNAIKGTKVTSDFPNCGCVRQQIRDKQKCMSPKSFENYSKLNYEKDMDSKEKKTDMDSKQEEKTDMYSKKEATDMYSKKYMARYPLGCFISQCLSDGSFLDRQCHGSKCWCVDNDGIPIQSTINNISEFFKCPYETPSSSSSRTPGGEFPSQESAASNIYLNILQLICLPCLLFFRF